MIVTALRGSRSEAAGVEAKVMQGLRNRQRRGASALLSLQRDGSNNGKSRGTGQDWRDR